MSTGWPVEQLNCSAVKYYRGVRQMDGADGVYPASEDTYLLIDALSKDAEFLRQQFSNGLCLEVGYVGRASSICSKTKHPIDLEMSQIKQSMAVYCTAKITRESKV